MKVPPRNTARRIMTRRITSPEYIKVNDKVQFLLGYIDDQAFHRSLPVGRELFSFAAGDNEEGQLPDGLDRLSDHQFIIHVGADDTVQGLDIIPARSFSGGVIPVKSADIQTVRLEWELGGKVCRVTQRPYKVKAAKCIEVIRAIDKLLAEDTDITLSTRLPGVGKFQVVESDAVEIKLSAGNAAGQQVYDFPAGDEDDE